MPSRLLIPAVTFLLLSACAGSDPVASAPVEALSDAPVRVHVATATQSPLATQSAHSATIRGIRQTLLAAETSGTVQTRIPLGTTLEKGVPILTLDATRARIEQERAAAALALQQAVLDQARTERQRVETLGDVLSEQERDRARSAEAQAEGARDQARAAKRAADKAVSDSTIRAPFSGSVGPYYVEVGDLVGPGTPLAAITDRSRLALTLAVSGAEVAQLSEGAEARLSVPDLGISLPARVTGIAPASDPRTGLFHVQMEADNPGPIRPGMAGTVALLDENPAVTQIPRRALLRSSGTLAVYVVEEGRVRLQEVTLGRQDLQNIEIRSGVSPGEVVVVDGHFALADGAPVIVDGS